MPLTYPKKFTDPDWKATEKKIKVSATGIGKTLRDLEGAVKTAGADLDHKKDLANCEKEIMKVTAFAKKAYDAISDEWRNAAKKKNAAAEKFLVDYRHDMGRYESELELLANNLAEKHLLSEKIGDMVQRFNSRVK